VVVFACHAYSAMTTDRPYCGGRHSGRGCRRAPALRTQFDPDVVELLCAVLADDKDAAAVA